MIEDYNRGTSVADGTHVGDYLDRLDWQLWDPAGTPEQHAAKREELRAGVYRSRGGGSGDRNIHFHVFELSNLVKLIQLMNGDPRRPANLEIVDQVENFPEHCPNGILLVLRVHKSLRDRVAGQLIRWWARGQSDAALADHAKTIAP